jgi:hypothetical protein
VLSYRGVHGSLVQGLAAPLSGDGKGTNRYVHIIELQSCLMSDYVGMQMTILCRPQPDERARGVHLRPREEVRL